MSLVAPPRPLLLIDVDGVISLFGFPPTARPDGLPTLVNGIPHWLSAHASPRLLRLSEHFECVWCTGWEEKAEEHLTPLLGLPGGWPHLSLGQLSDGERHWKLDAICEFTGPDRAVAWIDDAHDPSCDEWVASRAGPTLLVRTDPAVGVTEADVELLVEWARVVGA
jgi:hypothetical protein